MITVILEGGRIPRDTTVRKVTGQQTYTLCHEIKIYQQGDNREIKTTGVVFLIGGNAINGYPDTTRFAVDLEDDNVMSFLKDVLK